MPSLLHFNATLKEAALEEENKNPGGVLLHCTVNIIVSYLHMHSRWECEESVCGNDYQQDAGTSKSKVQAGTRTAPFSLTPSGTCREPDSAFHTGPCTLEDF